MGIPPTEFTLGRLAGTLVRPLRRMGRPEIIGGLLFVALLNDTGQAFGQAFPGSSSVSLAWDASPSPEVAEATSGTITAPFIASSGMVYQATQTTLASSGRAAYSFDIVDPGDYLVSANVDAPNEGANSFFVNVDAEPTDPHMVWLIPVTTGVQSRTVPRVFPLMAGTHQLIVRGREPNTKIGTITLTRVTDPAPASRVRIRVTPGRQVVLTVEGRIGEHYDILAAPLLAGWTTVGTVALGASSSVDFTDTNAASFPRRFYRTLRKP